MTVNTSPSKKQRGAAKFARIRTLADIPVQVQDSPSVSSDVDKKPRITLRNIDKVEALRKKMREHRLVTVCEEASCPNLNECFSHGTASFMIMGDKCTRRCSFCDVAHGRPDALDPEEPKNLAKMIKLMGLSYVVITSVDRDDLRDGGAAHFASCMQALRAEIPGITVEILVPDFRGRRPAALAAIEAGLPDVFNHNIETVPRLYKQARPGSDYMESLRLLQEFKQRFSHVPTKSGLMLGLGETLEEVEQVMVDLRAHDVDMITLGQYLAPSRHHFPVMRYIISEEFKTLGDKAKALGFKQVASGPLVRSSYHADQQAAGTFQS